MSALPANFWDDLNDPDVQYAEQLVYDYLLVVVCCLGWFLGWGMAGALLMTWD